jgi:hypothetical protein
LVIAFAQDAQLGNRFKVAGLGTFNPKIVLKTAVTPVEYA